jgi:hypothetical protein
VVTPAPTIVVVVRAVVIVVVDALSSPASFDGAPDVTVGAESALDRRQCGSNFIPVSLLLRRSRIRAVGGWRSSPPALRGLA